MSERIKFLKEFNHFCSRITWQTTHLDKRAEKFFNQFEERLDKVLIEQKQEIEK